VREGKEKWAGGVELGHEREDGPAERNRPKERGERELGRWGAGPKEEEVCRRAERERR
jgi:hypothetical protein